MNAAKIDAATVACLTYAAKARQPVPVAATVFLQRLLADSAWNSDEVGAVTVAVCDILEGLMRIREEPAASQLPSSSLPGSAR